MKKKLFCLLLVVALMISCGCGNGNVSEDTGDSAESADAENVADESENADSDKKATIITNDGETVEMTADELIDAYDSNEARFKKVYEYAKIKFTGTISRIAVDDEVIVQEGYVNTNQNKIVFDEGWCLALSADNHNYDLADFMPGDVVTVTTSIFGSPYDTEFLREVSDQQRYLWLVGNDEFDSGYTDRPPEVYSTIETVIEY